MMVKHVSHPNENEDLSLCEVFPLVKFVRSVIEVTLNNYLKRYMHNSVQVAGNWLNHNHTIWC